MKPEFPGFLRGARMELAREFGKGRMKEANVRLFFYGSLGSRPVAGEWVRVAFAFRVEPKAVSIARWKTHYWALVLKRRAHLGPFRRGQLVGGPRLRAPPRQH